MSKRKSEKDLQLENEELRKKLKSFEEKCAGKKNVTSQHGDHDKNQNDQQQWVVADIHKPTRNKDQETLDMLMREVMGVEVHDAEISDKETEDPEGSDRSTSPVSSIVDDNKENETEEDKVVLEEEVTLDDESREALGEAPFQESTNEVILNKELTTCWKFWIQRGMKKEERDNLKLQYKYKGDCPLVAPKLNPEVASALNPTGKLRDQYFFNSQECLAAGLTALGQGLTIMLRNGGPKDRAPIRQCLADSGKLLADLMHQTSTSRRAYILPGLDAKFKSVLEESKPDTALFGEDFRMVLKAAKSCTKAGHDLLPVPQRSSSNKKATQKASSSGNYRGQASKGGRHRQAFKPKDPQKNNDQSKFKKDQAKSKTSKYTVKKEVEISSKIALTQLRLNLVEF